MGVACKRNSKGEWVQYVMAEGIAAHGQPIAGNPMRNGARALSANISTEASGDIVDLISTLVGALVIKPFSIPEQEWSYSPTAAIANTTDVVLQASAGAGLKNYLTSIQMQNSGATATEVVIKAATTVIWRGFLTASSQIASVTFASPLKTSAAQALNFACITTGASVYVNAQGYKAP